MPEASSSQWAEINKLHAAGLNLIAVRDTDDDFGKAKTPFEGYIKYRAQVNTIGDLWAQMDKRKTNSVAVITGKISGNLEVIDIDTKHKEGIDATIFFDLKELYPELYKSLRIDRTPSGGYHILYRIADNDAGSSCNLASRLSTDAELKENPKRQQRCFIELKAEKALTQMPPSPGYTVHQDNPIPSIQWQERCSIINLMKSYHEIVEISQPYKPSKRDFDYYDENPFEHFNKSDAAASILIDYGWKIYRKGNPSFIYFTHPESKSGGVHASFNKQSCIYRIFTSNSEFDPEKMYNPATVLSILMHKGDKRSTFAYLTGKGYGKIKECKEQQIAKKAATNNKPLPPNMSNAGIAMHAAISKQLEQLHPYGVFWVDDPEKGIMIDRQALYAVSEGLGFMLYNDNVVRVINNVIHEQSERQYFDTVSEYIKEPDTETYKAIFNSLEPFIERHGRFTISRLKILPETDIIQDTRDDCFKFYQNGMLHITKEGWELTEIPNDKYIFLKAIQQRNFKECNEGLYVDFLDKAIGVTPYLLKCIGYMAHEYKMKNNGYLLFLSEQCQNPMDGGGSGKNIFSNLFAYTTTYFNSAGAQIKYDERFLQSWNYQKIFSISDALKNFNFEFLKEMVTGTATMKRLNVNTYSIPVEKMPKFIVSSQFSFELKDGGIKRRIRPIEFTEFFTKAGGVDKYYGGKIFPDDWTEKDWGSFDTTIALAVQVWLSQDDRKLPILPLTESGWYKQFEHTYHIVLTSIIKENIDEWAALGFVPLTDFKANLSAYYNENSIHPKYQPSMQKVNNAIADWCKKHSIEFVANDTETVMHSTVRGKSFKKLKLPPEE